MDLKPELRAAALSALEAWLDDNRFDGLLPDPDYRPLLERLIADKRWDFLLDSFYQTIPFGTGGRRGPVGVGPNRINPFTIGSSVQGHVEYLRQHMPEGEELKVVVAYDVRKFEDLRGAYPEKALNPLHGLTSKDLAQIAASVYCAAGVKVYMLPDEPADFISTPELSFLIRRYKAHGGLNTSASHNHPDDNGGKFYNGEGGQE
ncbi:MAG: phospho-sugar mutase, partial [Acidobacteriota bacterium]